MCNFSYPFPIITNARTAETAQSYSKGGQTPSQTTVPRSAASPLSPPRPGPGAAGAVSFPSYAGVPAREAPMRYVQNTTYSGSTYVRENPFTRVPPHIQSVVTEYRQGVPPSVSNNLPASISIVNSGMDVVPLHTVVHHQSQLPTSIQSQSPTIAQQVAVGGPLAQSALMVSAVHQSSPSQSVMQQASQSQPTPRPRISLLHPNSDFHLSTRSVVTTVVPPDGTGPPAFKKIRLNEVIGHSLSQSAIGGGGGSIGTSGNVATTMLKVDTREAPVVIVPSGAYHPQVEAISPTLPSDPMEELRATKDELLQQIAKVDNDIDKAEKKIASLKKKQESLEEASAKPATEDSSSETQPKHRNLAQKIYAENRKRASAAHAVLSSLCSFNIDLPLYNQPSDAEVCREIQERHRTFKDRLLLHFRSVKSERAAKQSEMTERYALLSQDWAKRVDKMEASAKRKAKEAKNREFFEKVFPELRKQREDKERFNRVGSRIKSEADLEEIMDGLQEQVGKRYSNYCEYRLLISLFHCLLRFP